MKTVLKLVVIGLFVGSVGFLGGCACDADHHHHKMEEHHGGK